MRMAVFHLLVLSVLMMFNTVDGSTPNNALTEGDFVASPDDTMVDRVPIEALHQLKEAPIPDVPSQLALLLPNGIDVQYAGYLVALDKGYYDDEELPPVKIITAGEDVSGLREYRLGHIQFTSIWLPRAYRFYAMGSGIVAIAQVSQEPSLGVLVRSDIQPSIKIWEDLNEHRISVFYRFWENSRAVGRMTNVKVEPVFSLDDNMLLLRREAVDAICFSKYKLADLQYSRYRDHILFIPMPGEYALPEDCLTCSKAFLFQHPQLCRKFVLASYRGWQTTIEDKEVALASLKKHIESEGGVFDRKLLSKQLDEWILMMDWKPELIHNGFLSEKVFHHMRAILAKTRIITSGNLPEYNDFFYPVMLPETMDRIAEQKKAARQIPQANKTRGDPLSAAAEPDHKEKK